MKIKCPEFFRLEFPNVPWFVEILEETLPFIKIRGKGTVGNVIEGWVRKHVIYNEEE